VQFTPYLVYLCEILARILGGNGMELARNQGFLGGPGTETQNPYHSVSQEKYFVHFSGRNTRRIPAGILFSAEFILKHFILDRIFNF
jgi:hypothetical protein